MIVAIAGSMNSGKDTLADYLVNFHEYRRESFASSLKDAISSIFGWDRTLLEGRTKESREWREQIDPFWSSRLNIPHLTPRWVLQHWGTDVARNSFHNDIWIASLEYKLRNSKDNIVITDCRFTNEFDTIKKIGGKILQVKRGDLPPWYDIAISAKQGDENSLRKLQCLNIHESEWSWVGLDFDAIISNDGSIAELYETVENYIPTLLS
jgi:hypothetical protein